jgi:hypothetical protein
MYLPDGIQKSNSAFKTAGYFSPFLPLKETFYCIF